MELQKQRLEAVDDGAREFGALHFGCTLHEAGEVVGDLLGADGAIETLEDEVGRLGPSEVTEHHLAGEHHRTGVDHVLAGVLRGRAMGGLEDRVAGDVVDVAARSDADATDLGCQRVAQVVTVQVQRGDHVEVGRTREHLLQGEVGAGKTLVAVASLLVAVQGGHQGALMAPTEVLAEQHHLGIRALLEGFTVPDGDESNLFGGAGLDRHLRVVLLTNRTPAGERRRLLADLAEGSIDIVIGTHALISEGIEFHSLGVVVIDEQHRFGVEQRAALRDKGSGEAIPDVLVMTATPIPRTAAMTVYGDLDVSVLDELPPGRTPILTRWARTEIDEADVWQQVRDEVAAGRQAYVVCPLIDESEKLEVHSAHETYEELAHGELAGLQVGLLHGRVPAAEKETVMGGFRSGAIDVLVATTVIEVGVDVPNATVMVILDASRFGIAQLHQLRGRVGRGAAKSFCWLVGEPTTADGEARLEALVHSTDGFELAEIDLDLRGEGTIMGERQKGQNDLKLASLRRDREWVVRAREAAIEILDADPDLSAHALLAEEVELLLRDDDTDFLLKG